MMKYLLSLVVVAVVAITGMMAATVAANHTGTAAETRNWADRMGAIGAEVETSAVDPWKLPLDKSWTTGAQENEAGSQVLVFQALASLGSIPTERTGFV